MSGLSGLLFKLLNDEGCVSPTKEYLIAAPENFNGKCVVISGYISREFEDHAIYLDKDGYFYHDSSKAIWVSKQKASIEKSLVESRHVMLRGVYFSNHNGHMGAYLGELRHLSHAELLKEE